MPDKTVCVCSTEPKACHGATKQMPINHLHGLSVVIYASVFPKSGNTLLQNSTQLVSVSKSTSPEIS